jgi:SPX domain protein involved in polyphosphate accumulation
MSAPAFNDRVEKKYQIGIDQTGIADLWRGLGSTLRPFGLLPVQEITSVGSVYFDNKDCDLLRFSLLGHLMLFRTRAYEMFGQSPEPITEYYVEVKTAQGQRRMKRRFPLAKKALLRFLASRDLDEGLNGLERLDNGPEDWGELYREGQETLLTMGLAPILLVTYKRLAFQSEMDRLSIDWDIQYYPATRSIYDLTSWKYLAEPPIGKANKIILEMKCLGEDTEPDWFAELQRRYPIRRREYLKPVEGMGFLFQGPLRQHKEAAYFLPRIDAYLASSVLG